jgi:hypothetical protein
MFDKGYASKLASTPLSPRQQEVLDAIRTLFHGEMEGRHANYRRIASYMGWRTEGGVKDCLFALRAKGRLVGTGQLATAPDSWKVV